MKVEIADDFSALMEMSVSNTLALGTLMDWLMREGVIDRARFVGQMRDRRRAFQHGGEDGHAFAFDALIDALRPMPPALVVRDGQMVGLEA